LILVPLAVAANVAEVQPATIRKWVERGIITRHPDGYDLTELLHWIDTRDRNMADLATRPRGVA
jgi:hypothetical protein